MKTECHAPSFCKNGEETILLDAAGVSQITVNIVLSNDDRLPGRRFIADEPCQIAGGDIVIISLYITDILRLPHPDGNTGERAYKEKEYNGRNQFPNANVCPYSPEAGYGSLPVILGIFPLCIIQGAMGYIIPLYLITAKKPTPQRPKIRALSLTVSFSVLSGCHEYGGGCRKPLSTCSPYMLNPKLTYCKLKERQSTEFN